MQKITWVCKNCGNVVETPENKIPNAATDCSQDGLRIHDWQPVAVEKGLR